ncbi:ALKBH8 [Symbiodinium natans]|uniref:ALKBH8 protein n=1 Tax=Symbiodinium natans TaxID=878477 RepID=A0A812SEG8_9DINO|nr:ALKBH8 [Symbiodinium natans]
MTLLTLDPASFRRPKGQQSTRHLYLANCGYGRGESVETVLARLEPQGEVLGLHVGDGGVSYASFSDACTAEKVKANLEGSTSWVIRFAELSSESTSGVLLPESVEATQHVEVPGLHVVTDFITDEESVSLLREIDARPWDTSIKRRVQHYGHAFDYATLKIAEQGTVPTMPSFAAEVISRLRDSSLMPHEVDQLTVNEYEPGVGIAFHVDAHSAFEDGIAAITLGSGIVMEFRKTDATSGKLSMGKHHRMAPPQAGAEISKHVWLPPKSLLIISGEARFAWQHGIAWRKTDCLKEGEVLPRSRRVSLTFRRARCGRPCDCQWPALCDSQTPEAHAMPTRVGSSAAG